MEDPDDGNKSLSKAIPEEPHRGTECLLKAITMTQEGFAIRLKRVCTWRAVVCENRHELLNSWQQREMRCLHYAIVRSEGLTSLSGKNGFQIRRARRFWTSPKRKIFFSLCAALLRQCLTPATAGCTTRRCDKSAGGDSAFGPWHGAAQGESVFFSR